MIHIALLAVGVWAQSSQTPFYRKLVEIDKERGFSGVVIYANANLKPENAGPMADFLKDKVAEARDPRYGLYYALWVEGIGLKSPSQRGLLGLAATAYFDHLLWLRQDASRCVDVAAADEAVRGYTQHAARFGQYYKALSAQDRALLLKSFSAFNDRATSRPVNGWICAIRAKTPGPARILPEAQWAPKRRIIFADMIAFLRQL